VHPLSQFLCRCCTAREDIFNDAVESTGSIIRIDPIRIKTLNEVDYDGHKKYEKDQNRNSILYEGTANGGFEMAKM
jgi:hypothetical protein